MIILSILKQSQTSSLLQEIIMKNEKHVAVIGGGITGLSAAWELQKRAQNRVSFSLLERDNLWGGKVVTRRITTEGGESIIIDGGPESFVTRKPEVWELAHQVGVQGQIIDPGSETSHMFVLDGGKPVPVPLNPLEFIRSPLMSTRGKLRMLAEPFIPPKRDGADESLAQFASRRLGVEAMEKFIGPILAGIYNTDPHRQSILTTSPIMREMEAEYGGLFKGAFGRMRAARKQDQDDKPPRFIAFENGAQELVTAIIEKLDGDLRLSTAARQILNVNTGYTIRTDHGDIQADALILATPANAASQMLSGVNSDAADLLAKIRHENIGTLSLVYRAQDVSMPQRIHGMMVPRREGRKIDAVTFTSLKMPARAPEDYLVMRVFIGGGAPEIVEQEEAALVESVRAELADLLGIVAEPVETALFRWPKSFPQADVGHLDLVADIQKKLLPGIFLAGSSYRGIGVPDCIRQGQDAAQDVLNHFAVV
jgi:protoporphyrinogen/coproporphyrinogen III oxidase